MFCHFLLEKCQEAAEDVRLTDKKEKKRKKKKAKIVFLPSDNRDSHT